MATTKNTRRHRAGENPDGRPARDLVDAYRATTGTARVAVPA